MRFGEPPEVASLSLKIFEQQTRSFLMNIHLSKESKLATAMIVLRRDSGRSATFPQVVEC